MALIDLHSQWGTKWGYVLRTEAGLGQQHSTWKSEPKYHSQEEMVAYFKANDMQHVVTASADT